MNASVVKAPTSWGRLNPRMPVVFLAGSIEMGAAEPWQAMVEAELSNLRCIILNPRRDDWDASWVQSIHNPQFSTQVNWELDGIEDANVVALYLDPATKSPIILLELGLLSQMKPKSTVVCCPNGFWRQGNVDIVCARYGIEQVADKDALCRVLRERVKSLR